MAKPLSVGVLGAGRIGKVHARTIATRIPEARIAVIADRALATARALAAELGVGRAVADPLEVLADPGIEAVLVCSSTDTHADMVTRAAAAGKHVFCEKPLDMDLGRIDDVLGAVEASGVKLMMGFNRRFDPDFAALRAAVARGVVGVPHILRITSRDPAPPPLTYIKVSGGMFMDMTIHDFDMARYVMGREVVEVYAAAAVLVDPGIGQAGDVDTAVLTLRFEGGALGVIDNSRKAVYGYDQRVEVLGSAGMVANGNHSEHTVVESGANGIRAALPLNFFMERYAAAYEAEMRAFVACLTSGGQVPVGGADARAATVMAYAAMRSRVEGRPVLTRDIKA